jgi:hypothetical protein
MDFEFSKIEIAVLMIGKFCLTSRSVQFCWCYLALKFQNIMGSGDKSCHKRNAMFVIFYLKGYRFQFHMMVFIWYYQIGVQVITFSRYAQILPIMNLHARR